MSWYRTQYKSERRQPRHARVHLSALYCEDCGNKLHETHMVSQFGGRCRPCWHALAVEVPGMGTTSLGFWCAG